MKSNTRPINSSKATDRRHSTKGSPLAVHSTLLAVACLLIASCTIENDIPYPTIEAAITAITIDGQCDADGNSSTSATIKSSTYTASLYVDDTEDISSLRITSLTVSNNATIAPADATQCIDATNFPTTGFASLDSLSSTADTRMDFSQPVVLTLTTYQDYDWTISVTQVLNQEVELQGQVGDAVIDNDACTVTLTVSSRQDLTALTVNSFLIGGAHGTVSPDPTGGTYDFSSPATFAVGFGWEDGTPHTYTVTVETTDVDTDVSASAFVWNTRAYLTGYLTAGDDIAVQYKAADDTEWIDADELTVSGTTYTATLLDLTPGETYNYRTNLNTTDSTGATTTTYGTTLSLTTLEEVELTDGDFENWHYGGTNADRWDPWAEDGDQFWDTGNRGSMTLGSNLSTPSDDTCDGLDGYSAKLQSKWMVLRFGSASIFTGTYDETVGINAVLSFGRPFVSFPSKLRINYKYTPQTITKIGDDDCEFLRGQPDSCWIYIALTDWDEPYTIRTKTSERQLFNQSDEHVIAFADIIKGEEVADWTTVDLELEYRYTDRTPTHILVVAAASKYGDYFCGGDGSLLYVDNFELIYE